jgi:PAS domain S-box-containing protein
MTSQIFDITRYMFTPLAVQVLVTALAVFSLGIFALTRERGSQRSVAFFLLTQAIGIWLFCFSWVYSAADEQIAMWWARAASVGVALMPAAIYYYSGKLWGDSKFTKRAPFIWSLSTIFATLIISTDMLFGSLYHYSWGFYPKYGVTSVPFLLYFFGVLIGVVRHHWAVYRRTVRDSIQQIQAKSVLIAFSIAYLASFDYIAVWGVPLYPFGYIPIFVFIVLSGRAIVRFQLLAITPALAAHQIIDTMQDALIVLDRDGVIRLINQATCSLLGYSEEDLVGKRPTSSVINNIPFAELLESFIQGGMVRNYEVDCQTQDSTPLTLSLTTSILRDRAGEPLAIVCVARDVTEHKRADEDLKQSLSLQKATLESTADGLLVVNSAGRITTFNARFAEMWRLRDDILASLNDRRALNFVTEQLKDPKSFLDNVQQLYDRPDKESFDVLEFKDGRVFERYSKPQRIGHQPVGRVWSFRDVTERKRTEEVLIKNDLLLRRAEEVAKFGSWEFILDENKVNASDGARSIYGLEAKEWSISDVQRIPLTEYRPMLDKALKDLIEHGIPYNVTFRICRPTDNEIIDINSMAEYDAAKKVVFGVMQNITERVRADKDKDALQAQLLEAQKMESVGRLAGGVAHDFNNMLSAILGHAELAMMHISPSDQIHSDLKAIERSAFRSAELVRQLLAYARRQTVAPKVLDLNDRVTSMLNMLQRLIGEDIDLVWMPGARLWSIKIDPSQIDQLLANLCVNARDAIPGVGKVIIKTENAKLDDAYCAAHKGFICGDHVLLAVSDNGSGMSKEVLDHLFEPFFTTKEVGKGTGLGLATVYGIVKQNEGFINVYSEPGKGSTFNIYLPRVAGEALKPDAADATETPKGRGETVLLVEDETVILNVVGAMLEELGYTVLTASAPGEALRQAETHGAEIKLLITDVVMPEMNGRDLAKSIGDIIPGLKYLFTSGYTADIIAHRGVLDEGVHFLQKPFSLQKLASKVREVLKR